METDQSRAARSRPCGSRRSPRAAAAIGNLIAGHEYEVRLDGTGKVNLVDPTSATPNALIPSTRAAAATGQARDPGLRLRPEDRVLRAVHAPSTTSRHDRDHQPRPADRATSCSTRPIPTQTLHRAPRVRERRPDAEHADLARRQSRSPTLPCPVSTTPTATTCVRVDANNPPRRRRRSRRASPSRSTSPTRAPGAAVARRAGRASRGSWSRLRSRATIGSLPASS